MAVTLWWVCFVVASLIKAGQTDEAVRTRSNTLRTANQLHKPPHGIPFLRALKKPSDTLSKKSYPDSYYNPSPSAYPSYYPYSYPYPASSPYPSSIDDGDVPTNGGTYAGQPVSQTDQYHCTTYPGTPGMNRSETFEIKGKTFKSIGCWRDNPDRAIETLEGKHRLLKDLSYKSRVNALIKCATAALDMGLVMFSLQNGGQCFGGKDGEKTFRKYGPSTACCGDGEGGPWSNEVYSFLGNNGKPIVNASYNPWSPWSPCSQTCQDDNQSAVQVRNRTCFTAEDSSAIQPQGCYTTFETRPCGVQICPVSVPKFQNIGCFKDEKSRAIPTLEGQDSILDGEYWTRKDPIEKCYQAAKKKGFQIFAVQNGGWCASSATASETFDKYGSSSDCKSDGEGGPWANQVYSITATQEPPVTTTPSTAIATATPPTQSPRLLFLPSSPHPSSVCRARVDLVVVIDGSGGIDKAGLENFRRTLNVVKKVVSAFEISNHGVHVGIIVFSTGPRVVTSLNEHHYDRNSVLEAVGGIRYPGGYRNIGNALELSRNKLYHESDRHGLPKMLIVFSRGLSQDYIAAPAQRLRDSGVTIFSVGIGDYDMRQLREMATDPDSKHVYRVDVNDLDGLATSIKYRVCRGSGGAIREPQKPAPTVCNARLDLAILIDTSQRVEYFAGRNFRRSLQFIKQLVSGFNIGIYGTHVGIVIVARDARVVFGFQRYFNIWAMLKAIDTIKYSQRSTFIGNGLDVVRTQLFYRSAREGVPRMLLVMTDSPSQDAVDQPSKKLRDMGVTIFSLGVGKEYDINQLNFMATDPDHDHVFTSDFSHLHSSLVEKIKDKICTRSGGVFHLIGRGAFREHEVTMFRHHNENHLDDENVKEEMVGEGEAQQQIGPDQTEELALEEEGDTWDSEQKTNESDTAADRENTEARKHFKEALGTYPIPNEPKDEEGSSNAERGSNGTDISQGGDDTLLLPNGKITRMSPDSNLTTGGNIKMRSAGGKLRLLRNNSNIERMEKESNPVLPQAVSGTGIEASEVLEAKDTVSRSGKPDTPSMEFKDEGPSLDKMTNIAGEGNDDSTPRDNSSSFTGTPLANGAATKVGSMLMKIRAYPKPLALYPLSAKYQAKDVIGGNIPGVVHNVVFASGPFNQSGHSLSFLGTPDSYIEFPNNGKLDAKNSISIFAWVLPKQAGPIFNYKTGGWGVNLWMAKPRKLFARFVDREERASLPALNSMHIKPNKWNFIGAVYDQKSGRAGLWINGKLEDNKYIGNISLATQYPVRMGARNGDKHNFRGRMSCVQIYNEALNPRQISVAKWKCRSFERVYKADMKIKSSPDKRKQIWD